MSQHLEICNKVCKRLEITTPIARLKYGFECDVTSIGACAKLKEWPTFWYHSNQANCGSFHRCWGAALGVKVACNPHDSCMGQLDPQLRLMPNWLRHWLTWGPSPPFFAMDMRGWGLSDGESMVQLDHMGLTFVGRTWMPFNQPCFNALHLTRVSNQRFLMGNLGGTVTAFCVAKHQSIGLEYLALSGGLSDWNPKLTSLRLSSCFSSKEDCQTFSKITLEAHWFWWTLNSPQTNRLCKRGGRILFVQKGQTSTRLYRHFLWCSEEVT